MASGKLVAELCFGLETKAKALLLPFLLLHAAAADAARASSWSAYVHFPPPPPPAVPSVRLHSPAAPFSSSESSFAPLPHRPLPLVPDLPRALPSFVVVSDSNLPGLPELRSQDQQVNAALPLGGTVRGTRWRLREERGPAMTAAAAAASSGGGGGSSGGGTTTTAAKVCVSTVTFRGFVDEPNRGVVEYEPGLSCADGGSTPPPPTTGRWVGKTTRVVQLTARWKVRLPTGRFIYKGFVDTERGRTVGRNGAVAATMKGLILTGEDKDNRVVGRFTADLLGSVDESLEDVKIGRSGGTIGFAPRTEASQD